MAEPVTPEDFKAAMASFVAGVTLVTTTDEAGRPHGLTATAFTSVSKSPPLCLVCVSHGADAYPTLQKSGRFAVSFLAREQQALSSQFATHGIDKFAGVAWEPGSATGCPVIEGALASLECLVTTRTPAGDHDVLIGAIQRIVLGSGEPLAYFRGRYADVVAR